MVRLPLAVRPIKSLHRLSLTLPQFRYNRLRREPLAFPVLVLVDTTTVVAMVSGPEMATHRIFLMEAPQAVFQEVLQVVFQALPAVPQVVILVALQVLLVSLTSLRLVSQYVAYVADLLKLDTIIASIATRNSSQYRTPTLVAGA